MDGNGVQEHSPQPRWKEHTAEGVSVTSVCGKDANYLCLNVDRHASKFLASQALFGSFSLRSGGVVS